ncbi:hypothetical protein [Erythrobacter sp. Alg231-14]|uniref:hypothetical protein n=1 Tax=Erythrobacter sp. Alg231-14 TaxID=1922225 RepID=UPI00307B88E1
MKEDAVGELDVGPCGFALGSFCEIILVNGTDWQSHGRAVVKKTIAIEHAINANALVAQAFISMQLRHAYRACGF